MRWSPSEGCPEERPAGDGLPQLFRLDGRHPELNRANYATIYHATMTKDPSKIKRCTECKRLVEASTMRPLGRTPMQGGVRYVCPDCFTRVMALRKVVQDTRAK